MIFPSLMGMVPEAFMKPMCFTVNPTVLRAASMVQVPVSSVAEGSVVVMVVPSNG